MNKQSYIVPSIELLRPLAHLRLLETFSTQSDISYYTDGEDLGDTEDSQTPW